MTPWLAVVPEPVRP